MHGKRLRLRQPCNSVAAFSLMLSPVPAPWWRRIANSTLADILAEIEPAQDSGNAAANMPPNQRAFGNSCVLVIVDPRPTMMHHVEVVGKPSTGQEILRATRRRSRDEALIAKAESWRP